MLSLYYYRVSEEEIGPISLDLLRREIQNGHLSDTHEVRRSEETSWTRVADFVAKEFNVNAQAASFVPIWEAGNDANTEAPMTNIPWITDGTNGPSTEELPPENCPSLTDLPTAPSPIAEAGLETPAQVSIVHPPESSTLQNESQWYVQMGQIVRGPMTFQKLIDMAAGGHILPIDRVRQGEGSGWVVAQTVPDLFSSPPSTDFSLGGAPKTKQIAFPSSASFARPSINLTAGLGTSEGTMPVRNDQSAMALAAHSSAVHPSATEPLPSPSRHSADYNLEERDYAARSLHSQEIVPTSQTSHSNMPVTPRQQSVEPERIRSEKPTLERRADNRGTISDVSVGERHKRRRGVFKEPQLFDQRTFVICVVVAVLLLYGWSLAPATVGHFEGMHSELTEIYKTLDKRLAEDPHMEVWASTRKEVLHKISSIEQRIRKLYSRDEIRTHLLMVCGGLRQAARQMGPTTVHMETARDHLQAAAELLHNWRKQQEDSPKPEKDPTPKPTQTKTAQG